MQEDVRASFEPLALLDVGKCRTVNDIVTAMAQCSFGARMLGEATDTLTEWAMRGNVPIIYDGLADTRLTRFLRDLVRRGWFREILAPEDVTSPLEEALVIGVFSDRQLDRIFRNVGRGLFVNDKDITRQGQIRDGYYPDVVFSHPDFVLPTVAAAILERLDGQRTSVPDLFRELRLYGETARGVVHGGYTLKRMVEDPTCNVCLTITGAMTIAQMGRVFCRMIDEGMVQLIACTGALMAHGFIQSVGLKHYKYNPRHSDQLLVDQRINRVTDTLEPEENFDHIEEILREILGQFDGSSPISPRIFNSAIGEYLALHYPGEEGILKSAYLRSVPVLVPALVDSELGNDVFVDNLFRDRAGKPRLIIDPEKDSRFLFGFATGSECLGIFTVGGGVPRNNVQNVAPLINITNMRTGDKSPQRKFTYGCRICLDPMKSGALSSCTYSEGGSWGKMDLKSGVFSEIQMCATQLLPFFVRFVIDTRER